MANTIRIKRSAVPGKVPTISDLALGELGLNTYDGKLYTKKDDGTPSIVDLSSAAPGPLTEIDGGSAGTVFTASLFTSIYGGSAVTVFTAGLFTSFDGGNA